MAPMLVMGLFGFVGKALGGIGKVLGGAVKIGLGAAKVAGGLGLIPGGGLVGKLAGTLLAAKRPMSSPKLMSPTLGYPTLMRAKPGALLPMAQGILKRSVSTPRLQQMSPVLPGGAIATRSGPTVANGVPPLNFSGSTSTGRKRKKRRSSLRRSGRKRSGRKRRLKFGSPAWRKKYLGHGRKRRRRRAA